MKTVIKALLAAGVLLPASAYAQDTNWQNRGDRGAARADRGDAQRGEWRGRGNAQAQAQPQVQAQAQAQVQASPQDYRRGRADRQDFQGRGDQRPTDQRATYQNRQDVQRAPSFQGRRDDQGRQTDRARDDRSRYDNGSAAVQRYQNERRNDARGDQGRGRQDWQGNRGYAQQYGNRYDNRGGTWNRDWRGDNRYNYNSYRASNRGAYRLPRYYAPSGWRYGYRRFSIGVTLSSFLWDQNYWIDDPYSYRLPEAYGPYRWVRYYDDALLVDIRTGRVVDSVYGIFY